MENWRKVWREGIAPSLSTTGLTALRRALQVDDDRLLQGATTSPPPLMAVQEWPVEACCVIGYCAWQGEGLDTIGEVEEFFAQTCREADERLGEPAICRHFLNWYDDTPRAAMRFALLEEVQRTLAERFPIDDAYPIKLKAA